MLEKSKALKFIAGLADKGELPEAPGDSGLGLFVSVFSSAVKKRCTFSNTSNKTTTESD